MKGGSVPTELWALNLQFVPHHSPSSIPSNRSRASVALRDGSVATNAKINLTYVDASSLVFLETKKLPVVWTTDRHLSLTGARVLPRGE